MQRHWPFWTLLLVIGTYTVWMLWTKVLASVPEGLASGGGGLYGDTAMHAAFTNALLYQGFPAQNPLYAGTVLVYPFLNDLLSALLVRMGFTLQHAFAFPQTVFFIGFLVLAYGTFKNCTNRLTAFLGLTIFFLGFGTGFLDYLSDSFVGDTLAVTAEYTNNGRDLFMHNVLTGLILPERSFLPGLFIGMAVVALLYVPERIPSLRRMVLGGVLAGILPLWHAHTFLYISVCVAVWLYASVRKFASYRKQLAAFLVPYLLLAVPATAWIGISIPHEQFFRLSAGWMSSGLNAPVFWIRNTGVLIPLASVGIWHLRKHLLLFVPSIIMFFLANIAVFQPWDWDNIKIFSWVFLFLSLAAGYVLEKLWKGSISSKLLSVILLFSLTASGTLSLIYAAHQRFVLYDNDDVALSQWARTSTQPDAVFLTEPTPNHPIPGLSGRSVYLGYPGHLWVHGIKYHEREKVLRSILNGSVVSPSTAPTIDYIVLSSTQEASQYILQEFSPVWTNHKYSVYQRAYR